MPGIFWRRRWNTADYRVVLWHFRETSSRVTLCEPLMAASESETSATEAPRDGTEDLLRAFRARVICGSIRTLDYTVSFQRRTAMRLMNVPQTSHDVLSRCRRELLHLDIRLRHSRFDATCVSCATSSLILTATTPFRPRHTHTLLAASCSQTSYATTCHIPLWKLLDVSITRSNIRAPSTLMTTPLLALGWRMNLAAWLSRGTVGTWVGL